MTPEFPLISIYKNQVLHIHNNENKFRTISTLAFLQQNPDESKLYDRDGNTWNFAFINDHVKETFWVKFLANTFHNATIKVDLKWNLTGKFTIDSLKADLMNAVDNDKHDLIAQFEEADTIKSAFSKCNSFDEILDAIKKLVLPGITEEHL